jgi:hypothetical protein
VCEEKLWRAAERIKSEMIITGPKLKVLREDTELKSNVPNKGINGNIWTFPPENLDSIEFVQANPD